MLRHLLTPRWIAGHLAVLALVGVFFSLGFWQLERLDEQREQIALIRSRTRRPPADLSRLVASPSLPPDAARRLVYRRATVRGTFDVGQEVLLEGRSHLGRPGRHVLTPLKTSDYSAVLVDRGWVPMMLEDPPVAEAAPPGGEVALTGVLLTPPQAAFGPADPPPGRVSQVPRIDLERLGEQVPYRLFPLYLHLEKQEPPNEGRLPTASPLAPPDDGPHLSYAIQWFSFGAIAAITYVAFIRRQSNARTTPDL